MEVRFATEAAPQKFENEDFVFRSGNLVGVLDGVSVPAGVDSGCVHGPAWYVHRLAGHLQRIDRSLALRDVLATAIEAVRHDHEGQCDLAHPNTPAATVALLREAGDHLDYLVLCDSYLVFDVSQQAEAELVTDGRFGRAMTEIRKAALTGVAIDSHEHEDKVRRAALARQQYTNRPGGYWVAAALPEAAYESLTGRRLLEGPNRVQRAALLTDGAASAVDRYQLFDWRGLLDVLTDHGPADLIRRVRAAEVSDGDGRAQPRYKRHDDAAAAICLFGEWT